MPHMMQPYDATKYSNASTWSRETISSDTLCKHNKPSLVLENSNL